MSDNSGDEKGLFDHLNAVKQDKDPDYWEKLSDSERKDWSTFMIDRFLSMNPAFTPIISELKPYTQEMEDRHVYRLYAEILPYDGQYWDYVSNKNEEKYPDWIVDKLSDYYEVSRKEARQYIDVFLSKEGGKEKIKSILEMYGVEDDKIKNVSKLG